LPVIVKLADRVVAFCTNGLVEGKVTAVAVPAVALIVTAPVAPEIVMLEPATIEVTPVLVTV